VRFGEAADFIVNETGSLSGGYDVYFANVLLPLRIDHSDRAVALQVRFQRFYSGEGFQIFGGEKDDLGFFLQLAARDMGDHCGEILQECGILNAENADSLATLDTELIEQSSVRIVALGLA
jgi:hypothetical protein